MTKQLWTYSLVITCKHLTHSLSLVSGTVANTFYLFANVGRKSKTLDNQRH